MQRVRPVDSSPNKCGGIASRSERTRVIGTLRVCRRAFHSERGVGGTGLARRKFVPPPTDIFQTTAMFRISFR